jgi:hypothetical protein
MQVDEPGESGRTEEALQIIAASEPRENDHDGRERSPGVDPAIGMTARGRKRGFDLHEMGMAEQKYVSSRFANAADLIFNLLNSVSWRRLG